MINSIRAYKAENGFIVEVERTIPQGEGADKWSNSKAETFVFEKEAKLLKALRLFASDLAATEQDPPF